MKAATATASFPPVAAEAKHPAYQAYQFLHWAFVIVPILAGLDKFFMKLTNWTQYLWPPLGRLAGGANTFMYIVGAIEIVAGFLVAFVPRVAGYIVTLWLWGIIANLLLLGNYYDIALRDFGLSLAALALARLAAGIEHRNASPTAPQ